MLKQENQNCFLSVEGIDSDVLKRDRLSSQKTTNITFLNMKFLCSCDNLRCS